MLERTLQATTAACLLALLSACGNGDEGKSAEAEALTEIKGPLRGLMIPGEASLHYSGTQLLTDDAIYNLKFLDDTEFVNGSRDTIRFGTIHRVEGRLFRPDIKNMLVVGDLPNKFIEVVSIEDLKTKPPKRE